MIDPPPRLRAIFSGFLMAGIFGFGGTLPWARRMAVDDRKWLTAAEFTDLLALCQFLPGPNIINLSVILGQRFRGLPGALAGFLGLLAAPVAVVLVLGTVYARFSELAIVRHLFAGLAAGASGLILGVAIKLAEPLRGNWLGIAIAAVAFIAIALLRLPLLPTMLVLAPLSIFLAGRRAA